MRVRATGSKLLILGSFLAIGLPIATQPAAASSASSKSSAHHPANTGHYDLSTAGRRATYTRSHAAYASLRGVRVGYAHGRAYAHWGGISCVPYARSASGIDVPGNAWQWWNNAEGIYARGKLPESGSVLSFQANGRMRLGHVAVVARVINAREVEVDHANWGGGGVARNVPVVDVSENNDWSAVRVGLGRSGDFGSVYPTNGFIYNRPDTGTMLAAAGAPAPQPMLHPAPADLRPYAERASYSFDEVAEAPPAHAVARHHATHHIVRVAAHH